MCNACSVISDSLRPCGLYCARLFYPWDFPGKNTGVGCHFLLQGIFLIQGWCPHVLHCRWILNHLSHEGSPKKMLSLFSHSVVSNSLQPHSFPVLHHLPELAQNHVHWVSDAIQPSHPLSSPSSLALNLSQHQSLFQWVNSSHEVAKVLEFQLEHQSIQRIPRTDLL